MQVVVGVVGVQRFVHRPAPSLEVRIGGAAADPQQFLG